MANIMYTTQTLSQCQIAK